tara:strand:+ start:2039 stop:3043 length:1005 start_codon:yes stop_codon:yes gene_type:complete
MKALPLIHTCWLKPFADYFSEKGISLKPYCEAVQIELTHVTTGDGWITKHQLYGFLQALAIGEKMPEVGFVVGERITPDCLGDLGAAMAQEETLGGVVRTFGRLINRHVEGNRCWLEEGEEGEVWLFNEKSSSSEPGRTIADQAGLMSMINLARLVAGKSWYPDKAVLQTESTDAHRKLPGLHQLDLKFDQQASGFAFPANWLLRSIQMGDLPSSLEASSEGLLNEDETIDEKLRLLLREIVGVGGMCPTVRLMGELCDIRPRTLHRRLGEAGVTYQKLLDEVRLDQAKGLLLDSELSVKEVAYELGYSGPNNFIRAFRRQTELSPTAYRRQSG